MPKLVLFAATLFSRPSRQRGTAAEAHAEHVQMTRSRMTTRRLGAFDPHKAWVDRSPLELNRRH